MIGRLLRGLLYLADYSMLVVAIPLVAAAALCLALVCVIYATGLCLTEVEKMLLGMAKAVSNG